MIELLARAYITTPIHVAVFGGTGEKELQLERIFWRAGTELVFRSEWYAALDGNRTVGVMHMVKSPQCRLSSDQQEAIGPRLAELGPDAAPRVGEVLGDWAQRDPDTDHYHLGPVAVLRELQSQGIGSLLMKHFCQRADETSILGYLDTDSSDNVRFYEKSGLESGLGGPMAVYDEIEFPWLNEEKTFIRESIKFGKVVLGMCLGAQLIADALGAGVFKGANWRSLCE